MKEYGGGNFLKEVSPTPLSRTFKEYLLTNEESLFAIP
jgi:hypothetical protein